MTRNLHAYIDQRRIATPQEGNNLWALNTRSHQKPASCCSPARRTSSWSRNLGAQRTRQAGWPCCVACPQSARTFKAFAAGIKDRCEELPATMELQQLGWYDHLA